MARNNDGFPSWMTVLKDPPVNTEDPVLKRARQIGRSIAQAWYTDVVRDALAGAAGGAAQYAVTKSFSAEKEAAGKTIGGAVNSGVQSASKKLIDWARRNPNARLTDAQIREAVQAEIRKDAAERQVMRMFGVPGY
jgi:hypothetical protein